MDHDFEKDAAKLKPGEYLETRKKQFSKAPPYIVVGNGRSSKDHSVNDVMDAFKVFMGLSKAQQGLFLDFKTIWEDQKMQEHYAQHKAENPNLIRLEKNANNYCHQDIKKRLSQNRNRTEMQEKGVLKKVKNGEFMLNPYIFIPTDDFSRIASIWKNI